MKEFLNIVSKNRGGDAVGIYSVCTAHPMVLEAAFQQAFKDDSLLLIEATANQVNQFGGYTGMKPADFVPFIKSIADEVGFSLDRLILGGDHLGPVCWTDEPAEQAMAKAHRLIKEYVRAGFKKIHLDTSMPCADDPDVLDDTIVATRAAALCRTAEDAAQGLPGGSGLVYVIGTEVPPPGGAIEEIHGLQVTPVVAVKECLEAHQLAFSQEGLASVWSRVIGLVVQPGVEFDHTSVHDFDASEAQALSQFVEEVPHLVFEAHSTDYQPPSAYFELVKRHFAILKVGPQLTFALREALFALSHIEDELISTEASSSLRSVCESLMKEEPKYWQSYYPDEGQKGKLYRRFSYSDRIRYYWGQPAITDAVASLVHNLENTTIPLPLISMYMPYQYESIRAGSLCPTPTDLIRDHIMRITERYAAACGFNQCEAGRA